MANNISIDGQLTAAAETVTSSETFTGPTTFSGASSFLGAVTISAVSGDMAVVAASVSCKIGTTLSSLVGFYGAAGTSQRSGAVQAALSCTAFAPATATTVVGFSSSVQFSNAIGLLIEIRQALVDAGMLKGSS